MSTPTESSRSHTAIAPSTKILDPDEIRVLHVDDDPDFGELVAHFLDSDGELFDVTTATNAEEGLERLRAESFGCVVSDYDMPGLNGIEFLEAVREDDPEIPFILFTGKGSEEVASEAISAGVDDYLQKGAGVEQYRILANRIENLVCQSRAESLVGRAFRAMDRSREGIALLDESGEFLYVNSAYVEIVGYDKDELIGELWEIVYPDQQVDRIYDEVLSDVPDDGHWTGDTVYQRKDGSRILVNHALIYSEEGTMICLLRDISDTEATTRSLHEERERFDLFVDAVEEYAIFLLDPNGYVTTWNEGAKRINGYTEEEILGDHFSVFYPEEEREESRPQELLERAKKEGSVTDEGWRVRRDGSRFWADVTITALTDEGGNIRGFGKVTREVTEEDGK